MPAAVSGTERGKQNGTPDGLGRGLFGLAGILKEMKKVMKLGIVIQRPIFISLYISM